VAPSLLGQAKAIVWPPAVRLGRRRGRPPGPV